MKHHWFGSALALTAAFSLSFAVDASAATSSAAQKEGVVVWYGTMNTKDMNLTANQFMKTHPGIKVQMLRLGSSQLPARVATEQRAGKYNADVISGDEFQVLQLVDVGAFQKYNFADLNKFLKGTVDPNGYWVNLYQNTTVLAWNPNSLKSDHLKPPSSVADFAKPEWRGKFGLDTGALNWYMGVLQSEKNGPALVKAIAENSPQKTDGHTQTVTQLAAGEFDATPTAYGYMANQQHRKGRSVDFVNPTPLLVSLNPIGMAKNAPHPAAAKVFIDWLLSKDGQQFIAQRGGGEISSRMDVKNNPAIWDAKHSFVIVHAPSPAQYNNLERQFRALFGLPQ